MVTVVCSYVYNTRSLTYNPLEGSNGGGQGE